MITENINLRDHTLIKRFIPRHVILYRVVAILPILFLFQLAMGLLQISWMTAHPESEPFLYLNEHCYLFLAIAFIYSLAAMKIDLPQVTVYKEGVFIKVIIPFDGLSTGPKGQMT